MVKSNVISATNANRLFWLGRYEERVHLTLHLLRKCYDAMIDGKPNEKRTERPQPAPPSPEELRRQREEKELKETVIERHTGKLRAALVGLVALAVIAVGVMLWLRGLSAHSLSR